MLLSAGDHPAGAMLSHVYKPMTLEALPPRPSVSVAITCYNYGQFLSACLDSCLNQTVPIDQIVVVDDGSTDASWQVLSGYAGSGSRVQAIHQANAGMCAATNTALRACTGDVVLLLDADDMFAPTRVERVLAALRQPIDGELPGWVHHALRRFSSTHSNLGLFSNYPAMRCPAAIWRNESCASAKQRLSPSLQGWRSDEKCSRPLVRSTTIARLPRTCSCDWPRRC